MPATPATQPSPKMGTRFTSGRSPSRFTSRASMLGVASPVMLVKQSTSMSFNCRPAFSTAARTATSPSRVASRIHTVLRFSNVSSGG